LSNYKRAAEQNSALLSKKSRKAMITQHQIELNISQNDAEMSDILTFRWIAIARR